MLARQVEKFSRHLARWHAKLNHWLAVWHVGTFIDTLASKNEKLARSWHVGTQARMARDLANSFIFMFHTCVEVKIQNMQEFYAISLTNVRPDLTSENHWIKKFHWTHFFWLSKNIFHIQKKNPFRHYILIEYRYIFSEWQILTKEKYFFDWT